MSEKDDESSGAWKATGRQLRADGRMTGDLPRPTLEPVTPPESAFKAPTLDSLTTADLVLDKKQGARPGYVEPGPYRDSVPQSRAGPVKWILLLVGLAAAALAAFAFLPGLQRHLPVPVVTRGTVLIDSEPEGATVKVAGQAVGQTPWAADNIWSGEVKYEVSAPGHKSRWGTFRGGEDVKLDVRLSKTK